MTPQPKRKSTRSRSGKRKGTRKMALPNLLPCPNCKRLKEPRYACPNCGYYR